MKKIRDKLTGLSSLKVTAVLCVNFLVFVLIYFFFEWFLNESDIFVTKLPRIDGFTRREVWLCLLLGIILDAIIDFKFLVKPMWDLEELIQEHQVADFLADTDESGKVIAEPLEKTVRKLVVRHNWIQDKNKLEERKREKAELNALQSQINPHFLYNALDSIRGYALLHDMDEISDITEALSRVFRNMISDRSELLPLRQEKDNIKNYMKIQQFRFNNKFDYAFEIEDSLLDLYMVPRMVLQPLVENSIMHGLERKIEGGWVRVSACATQHRLILTVTDNGAGISDERLKFLNKTMNLGSLDFEVKDDSEHIGIALININRRIKLDFGNAYGLYMSSTPNIRTAVEVVLPIILNRK